MGLFPTGYCVSSLLKNNIKVNALWLNKDKYMYNPWASFEKYLQSKSNLSAYMGYTCILFTRSNQLQGPSVQWFSVIKEDPA